MTLETAGAVAVSVVSVGATLAGMVWMLVRILRPMMKVEARIATDRLESRFESLAEQVQAQLQKSRTEIRAEIRDSETRMNARMDRMGTRMDRMDRRMTDGFAELKALIVGRESASEAGG